MDAPGLVAGQKNLFLNVPFDAGYEKLFVALIACTVAARFIPRCAIELPERGQGQLARIMRLLERCQLSIHELSRPERFNMPFELGLAAVLQLRGQHELIVMESRRHRLARRLSDFRIDPLIHGNGPLKLIAVLLDNLGGADPADVESIYRELTRVLPALKRRLRAADVFRKTVFDQLVSGATELAKDMGIFGG